MALYAFVVLFISNLGAIVDATLHPEIAYFDEEHLLVGGITAIVVVLLLGGLEAYLVQRRGSEAVLRGSEERHRAILATAMDGFWVADAEGRLVEVNEAFCRMSGYSEQELLALRIADLDASATAADTVARLQEIAAQREDRFETRYRRKDGGVLDVAVSVQYRPSEGGQFVTFLHDVTARKQAEDEIRRQAEQLRRTLDGAVLAMGRVVEARDPYTAGHERRVAELATAIAAAMGMEGEELVALRLAGTIHDVGKIAVPAEILSKPGRLSSVEFELIKQHPESGYEILGAIDFGRPVAEMVRQHHERLDGSGYPQGLSGSDILPEARILAVADVVEAMSSHRPYRAALGMAAALAEVREHAGVKYDAEVVATCVKLVEEQGFQFTP
jgi:PAS domain S-box-containing protein